MASYLALVLLIAGFSGVVSLSSARAASPGRNGRIAFSRDEGLYAHIYTMNGDGTDQTELTSGAVTDRAPEWSPDGSKILFLRITNLGGALYIVKADGSSLRRVTPFKVSPYFGSWSPHGRRIVFAGVATGACLDIIDVDGTHLRRLLCDGASESPEWSPAGGVIVFSHIPSTGGHDLLWSIKPDGSGLTPLTYGSFPDGSPDWAPDASRVAFDRTPYPVGDVYAMDPNGGNLANLTAGAPTNRNSWPAYSPDGTLIAYDGGQANVYGDNIYVMNADGTGFTRLTTDGLSASPDWQPLPP